MRARVLMVMWALLGLALPAAGQSQDSAMYVVRLGADTVAIERWTWNADSLNVVAVTRSPSTRAHRYVVRFDDAGRVVNVNTGAQGPAPTPTEGAVPIGAGTYAPYAVAVWYAARSAASETAVPMVYEGSGRDVTVRRIAPGEYTLPNRLDEELRVEVEPDGTVTSIDAGGTMLERVEPFDFESLTREFAERDRNGTGPGLLSPRAAIGGPNVMIDCGQFVNHMLANPQDTVLDLLRLATRAVEWQTIWGAIG